MIFADEETGFERLINLDLRSQYWLLSQNSSPGHFYPWFFRSGSLMMYDVFFVESGTNMIPLPSFLPLFLFFDQC